MSSRVLEVILGLSIAAGYAPGVAGQAQAQAQQRPGPAPKPFTMALAGDAIITRPLAPFKEPEFLKMIDLIRSADAAFVNLEMLFHDYEPYPSHESGGTWMRAEPALAKELTWAGFDVAGMANNHTGDYGPDGMRLTMKHAAAAGLVTAGTGENLYEAREARFFDAANGRVALISTASTFTPSSPASKPKGGVRGRPGLSPVRFTSTRILTRDQLEALRTALRNAGVTVPETGTNLTVGNNRFMLGDSAGVRSAPNQEDVDEIAAVVRNAAMVADYVIVSIHSHENGARASEPSPFLVTFARAMVDAGADVFVGHGPHVLRGIEIYKGKPIFYSLGDFMFQNETLLRLPFESYTAYDLGENNHVGDFNAARYTNDTRGFPANREVWESVVARPQFLGKQLVAIELHPITLGFGLPASQRGRPMLADRVLGDKILSDLITRSRPYGTTIENRNGIGVITVR